MKKIYFIGIFVFVLLGIFSFFFWPKNTEKAHFSVPIKQKTVNNPSATTTERKPQTKEIIYTNEGFSPSVLSVFAGDTVIFKNKSDKNFQPTNNALNKDGERPDFSSANPVPKNKQYEFIFTTRGEYGYYDLLDQSRFGVVIVN